MPSLGEAGLHVPLGAQQVAGVAGRQGPAHGVSSWPASLGAAARSTSQANSGSVARVGQQLGVPLHGDDVVARPLERLDRAVGAAGGHDPAGGDPVDGLVVQRVDRGGATRTARAGGVPGSIGHARRRASSAATS